MFVLPLAGRALYAESSVSSNPVRASVFINNFPLLKSNLNQRLTSLALGSTFTKKDVKHTVKERN